MVTCLPGKVRQPKTDVVTGLGVKDTTGKPKAEDLASETKAKVKDLTLEAKATIGWPRGQGHVLEDSNSGRNHRATPPTTYHIGLRVLRKRIRMNGNVRLETMHEAEAPTCS